MKLGKFVLALMALGLTVVLAWPVTVQAEQQKLAWISAQRVLDETRTGQSIKSRVEAYRDSGQKVIDLEESEIREMEARLEQQAAMLSEAALREKQKSFKEKLGRYQKKAMQLTQDLNAKKLELLEEFNDLLTEAISTVAKREGVAFIFDHGGETGLLYGVPSADLTDAVVAEINAQTPQ